MRAQISTSCRADESVYLDHRPTHVLNAGTIAELVFNKDQIALMHLILSPLIQQLSMEPRWQLWLTSQHKLSRSWLKANGLPLDKMMQMQSLNEQSTLSAMSIALRTGNYSVVIGWIHTPPNNEQRQMLEKAAKNGHTLGLIISSSLSNETCLRPSDGLKIPPSLYH